MEAISETSSEPVQAKSLEDATQKCGKLADKSEIYLESREWGMGNGEWVYPERR